MRKIQTRCGRSISNPIHHGRPLLSKQTDGRWLYLVLHMCSKPLPSTPLSPSVSLPAFQGAPAQPQAKGTGRKAGAPEGPARPHKSWPEQVILCKPELIAQIKGLVVTDAAIKK